MNNLQGCSAVLHLPVDDTLEVASSILPEVLSLPSCGTETLAATLIDVVHLAILCVAQ